MSAELDRHPENCCQNCGTFVTKQFARVFGNNQNEVYSCPECNTGRDRANGGGCQ